MLRTFIRHSCLIYLFFLFSSSAFANNCPTAASGVECDPKYLMGGTCIDAGTADGWFDQCRNWYGASSGLDCSVSYQKCVCAGNYEPNPYQTGAADMCRPKCPSGQLYCTPGQRAGAIAPASCVNLDYGDAAGVQGSDDAGSCKSRGLGVADYCTGACTGCPGGTVSYKGTCQPISTVVYDTFVTPSAFFGWGDGAWRAFGGAGLWEDRGNNDISNANIGNVGIGLKNPSVKLEVSGGVKFRSYSALVPALYALSSGSAGEISYGNWLENAFSSSTESVKKYGLYVKSTGLLSGNDTANTGLYVHVAGGANKTAGAFYGGKVAASSDGNIWAYLSGQNSVVRLTSSGAADILIGSRNKGDLVVKDSGDVNIGGKLIVSGGIAIPSTGAADFSDAARLAIKQGNSNPAACAEGDLFYNTTAHLTYVCTAVNVWTAIGAAGAAQFAGITSQKYTTLFANGYAGANAVCAADLKADFAGSHVCSSDEILSLYAGNDAKIAAETGAALINGGPPGFTANANDCLGWSIKGYLNGEKTYARWWDFSAKKGWMTECGNNMYGFACCK